MVKNKYLDSTINFLQCQGSELHLEVALDYILVLFLTVLKPVPIRVPGSPQTCERVSGQIYLGWLGSAVSSWTLSKSHFCAFVNNTTSTGSLKFMRVQLAYRNSVIYPNTGSTIAQTLLGRHLRDALPQVSTFYQLKKEFLVERKEREKLAAKLIQKMKKYFDRGSRLLPELKVGDTVQIQNHTTVRTTRWDLKGVI